MVEFLGSNDIQLKAEELIRGARESIKIASAWLKGSVVESLLEKMEENVELEVILRASELQDLMITDELVFERIKSRGGKIYLNNRLHAKFIVADGRRAILGSANITKAGFSDYSRGNIEAAVYLEGDEAGKIEEYFGKIKGDSKIFDENLLGFAINPVKSRSFEFVLLEPNVREQSYVEVRGDEGSVLAKITSIYSYDMGFFANPFSAGESPVFGSFETFKVLFTDRRGKEWKKAAVWSYLNDNGEKVRIAVAQVVGVVKDGKLETSLEPFSVGEPVYAASEETLKGLMKRNFSGKEMKFPVKVGTLEDKENIDVFIDGNEVITKHMLILGTTGSGKSHFAKVFLKRLVDGRDVQLFILDPHGEYGELFKGSVESVEIQDTLFPVFPEEVEEIVKGLGFPGLVSGNSSQVRENRAKISKVVKPSFRLTGLKGRSLKDVLDSLGDSISKEAETVMGEKIGNQQKVYEQLEEGLNSGKRVVIFNFSQVTDPQTRVNLAGLIMQELFWMNRNDRKERLVVLEEAHNFAPEGRFGDVSAGRDNLSLVMSRKIASEGRKFNLGLVVITQRPAQVSKYVLAQANTQAMFRTMNSADLEAVSNYVEFAGQEIVGILPSLQTGMGIVSGLGVPFPVLVRVDPH